MATGTLWTMPPTDDPSPDERSAAATDDLTADEVDGGEGEGAGDIEEDGEVEEDAAGTATEGEVPTGRAAAAGGIRAWGASANGWVERTFGAEARLARRPSPATKAIAEAKTPTERSEAERQAVNGLEPTEIRFGWLAAIAEVVLTVVLVGPYLFGHHRHTTSGSLSSSGAWVVLGVGLFLAGGMALGILFKRRGLLGFSALLVGTWLLQLKLSVLGFAYLAFGVWLVFRALRFQGNKRGAAARDGASGKPAATTPERTSSRSKKAAAATAASRAPKPNKRYTPPKPPSRRDLARKQAASTSSETRKT